MKYETHHTGYAGALVCLQEKGGTMFPRKGKDGVSTVNSGQTTYSFWEPNSVNYHRCKQLAEQLNFPHEHFTSGRIAKYILKDICGLNPEGTYVEPRILELARDGFHWHYTHVETGYHPYLLEFDLCQAYATTLVKYENFFFNMSIPTPHDSDSLTNLRELLPVLPKWMRMVMLGIIASHRMTFATMPNRASGDCSLKWVTISKVNYGAAFNQVHRAILRLYRFCQRLHEIGGHHIKRMHTDSFALCGECPSSVESSIFDFIQEGGYEVTCKAQGTSHFLSLNSGIVGRKFIGVPCEVRESIASQNERRRRVYLTASQQERWASRGVLPDRHRPLERTVDYIQTEPDVAVNDERKDGRVYERFA